MPFFDLNFLSLGLWRRFAGLQIGGISVASRNCLCEHATIVKQFGDGTPACEIYQHVYTSRIDEFTSKLHLLIAYGVSLYGRNVNLKFNIQTLLGQLIGNVFPNAHDLLRFSHLR